MSCYENYEKQRAQLIVDLRVLARRGATVVQMVDHVHTALAGPDRTPGSGPRILIVTLFIHAFKLGIADVNIIGAMVRFEGERGRPDQAIEASVYPHIARWLAAHPDPTEEEQR